MTRLTLNIDELSFLLHRGPHLPFLPFLNLASGDIITLPSDPRLLSRMLLLRDDYANTKLESLISPLLPGNDLLFIPDRYSDTVFSLMTKFIARYEKNYPRETKVLGQFLNRKEGFHGFHLMLLELNMIDLFILFRDLYYKVKTFAWLDEKGIEYKISQLVQTQQHFDNVR